MIQETTQLEEKSPETQGNDEQEASLLNEDDKSPKKEEAKPAGAPEAYAAFKAPDSWAEKGLKLDEKVIEKFTPIAKTLGLSQEQAQSLVDFYTGVSEDHSTAMEQASLQAVKDMRKEWRDEVKADKQVGHRLTEVKANMAKMYNAFIPQQGDPKVIAAATQMVSDVKKAMDLTGAGDHPAFVRFWDLVSQRFTEGTYVAGRGPSPGGQQGPGSKPDSAAKAMYPTLA